MHSHGLTAAIAAGDHGGMLLPGADPVADILDDLAPGTTRQRLRAPTTSLSRRLRRLYPNNISSRAKTTEASTAALRATTCSLAFAGSCGRIIRFTASCRRPSGDSRKARSDSSFARSDSSFANSNAAEDTTTPDPCRTSVDLGFQSAPTLRHRCQLSAEPVGAGLRYQARVQSRSSALRQRAFSLAGRSANSSWACSVNGAKQLHSYSSADSGLTSLRGRPVRLRLGLRGRLALGLQRCPSCYSATATLHTSRLNTGQPARKRCPATARLDTSKVPAPALAPAGCDVAKLGRAVAALRVGRSAQRSASLEPCRTLNRAGQQNCN